MHQEIVSIGDVPDDKNQKPTLIFPADFDLNAFVNRILESDNSNGAVRKDGRDTNMSIDATTRKSDPSTTTEDGIVAIATTAGEKENKSEPPASGIAAMAAAAALNRNENKKAEMPAGGIAAMAAAAAATAQRRNGRHPPPASRSGYSRRAAGRRGHRARQ